MNSRSEELKMVKKFGPSVARSCTRKLGRVKIALKLFSALTNASFQKANWEAGEARLNKVRMNSCT
jgi:hypothetical protein